MRSATAPVGSEASPLVDQDGERVGHRGRRPTPSDGAGGLGVALGEPRYVSRIDPLTNTITLGRRVDLETRTIDLERVSFVAGDGPAGRAPFRAEIRIRHRATPIPATVRPVSPTEPARGGHWVVETDAPVWAAAPGQAAVLYDGDVALGGGRIARPVAVGSAAAGSTGTVLAVLLASSPRRSTRWSAARPAAASRSRPPGRDPRRLGGDSLGARLGIVMPSWLGSDPDPDDVRFSRFLRGMTNGALVGAAIAGSALWGRARHRTDDEDSHPD
jgi:hypothetical protein